MQAEDHSLQGREAGRQVEVSDSCGDLFLPDLTGYCIDVAEVERLLKVTVEAWGWLLDCLITKLLRPVSFPVGGGGGSTLLTPLSPFLEAGFVHTAKVWTWALRNILSSSRKWCAASVNHLQTLPFPTSTLQRSKGFWKPVEIASYWHGSALRNAHVF